MRIVTHFAAVLLAGCAAAILATSDCAAAGASSTASGSKFKFDESLVAPPRASSAPEAAAPAPRPKSVRVDSGPAEITSAGKTLFEFKADNLELKSALASFARLNNLNIVPDNDVTGSVTLDVRNLPLEQMMRALLEASDCSWREEGGLIRIRNTETRSFSVDYLRLSRTGQGKNSATLSSSSGGSGGGGSGGGGGGGGGGSGGGSGGGGNIGSSSVDLTANNAVDFWKELREELGFMLTPAGKTALAMSLTAGIIQVTDRPSALTRVEHYLSSVDQSVHRQVDIEAKIYDVTLNDQFQFGIDWVHVAEAYGGSLGFGASTLPIGNGGGTIADSALGGINRITGSGNLGGSPHTLVFRNLNTTAAVNALQLQGTVEVISQPRIRTLNNQTALIKVGTETPFFAQTTQNSQSSSGNVTTSGDQITTITVGTILSITPQITDADWISMDISPVLTSLQGTETSPSGTATAPVLDTKQASTILRVRSGDTVVLGGLIQTEKAKAQKKVPLLGDIPGLGLLFTGTYHRNTKRELVIFVTPNVVREGMEPPIPASPSP